MGEDLNMFYFLYLAMCIGAKNIDSNPILSLQTMQKGKGYPNSISMGKKHSSMLRSSKSAF